MKAAVVRTFDQSPRYDDFPDPVPQSADEVLVDVVAVGLHPRVRSQVNGSHYTSTDDLPLVPGIDGVGRGPDGRLLYFVLPDTTVGSMAQHTVIDVRRSIVLPPDCDPIAVAAAMNPAMSSWLALRRRIDFQTGQDVLVLGATGNAGQMAVQIARRFGAGRIIAAARNADLLADLPALGASDTVVIGAAADSGGPSLGQVAADVDVVIDYLWGEPAASAMVEIVTNRTDSSRPLAWVQIGSVAGATAAIPSAALRATRLQIVGSGQGSVSTHEILAELPALVEAITTGTLDVDARTVALADIEQVWRESPTRQRVVVVP